MTGLWKETECEGECGGLPSCSSVLAAYLLGVSGVQEETERERGCGGSVSSTSVIHVYSQ